MTESFAKYLDFSNVCVIETRDIFTLLSAQHSIYKNNKLISEILSFPNISATNDELLSIHQEVTAYIMKIAPKSLEISAERNILALSEMIALQSTLSLLNALIVARSKVAIEKLASLNTTTRLATKYF